MSQQPIGIFDSGVGGLTVAKAIKELLPHERIIYFGDTLHLPYGEKSSHSIKRYASEITRYLLDQGCKSIVIACNSASAHALSTVQELATSKVPVIDVIDPMANYVNRQEGLNSVGVIGTKATIRSGVYQRKIKSKNLRVLETPLLASMVEEGFVNNDVSKSIISTYLNRKELQGIAALILGCTHYPLLKSDISDYYQGQVSVLDSSEIVAKAVQQELNETGLLNRTEHSSTDQFLVSDYTPSFEKTTGMFFGAEINLKELKIT